VRLEVDGGESLRSPSRDAASERANERPGAPGTGDKGGPSASVPASDAGTVAVAERCGEGAATLPAAFVAQCAGCHGTGARYPDLTRYAGSEASFLAKVRAGGKEMPAFSPSTIDDATLRKAYAALTEGARDMPGAGANIDIAPLFAQAADVAPITFRRADGVQITRGAGRVRQRHELEATYGPFGPHYFEHRTFGFIVEDFTLKGESRVRVSYLPIARPETTTNFRAFKIFGENNVFHINLTMKSDTPLPSLAPALSDAAGDYARTIAPYARVQTHEVTAHPRAKRPIQQGDILEFEFGVFIEPGAVTPNTRTSYYSDTFRYRVGQGGLTPENLDTSGKLGPRSEAELLGGATTIPFVYAEPETALSQMALNTQHEHVQPFVEGRRLFHTDFGSGKHSEGGNPPLMELAGKLGPLFVAPSCASCHPGNGGGKTLAAALDQTSSMVFKLYGEPQLGNQLQLSEGSAKLSRNESSTVTLADGTDVVLTRPLFSVVAGTRPLAHSPRIARRLVGMGLLEALDEQTLIARADTGDCDGDGISGRPSLVRDKSGALRLGRFGWKAEKVSVEQQVADALEADLGVSTRVIPDASGAFELADDQLARLTTYMRLLGIPPQRDGEDAVVKQGALLFASVGCASCHTPELISGDRHPFVELRRQTVRPYSDLLLHDLGPELADQSGEDAARATAAEWRTAPLWGLAAARDAQGHVSLLHDGRAKSVLEAVLWHGGEAAHIRKRFEELPTAERAALLRFVESL
jgi:CxxC motif-containing protein (DUF1111 family)